jgi:DNA-binding transcriptional ArsR family regulator
LRTLLRDGASAGRFNPKQSVAALAKPFALTAGAAGQTLSFMTKSASTLDNLFSAFGDPTRRAVVARLSEGPCSVSELARPHDMALPSFLGHLRKLEEAGIVVSYKKGRVRTCHLVPGALGPAREWITRQHDHRPDTPSRLDAFVSRMKR